MRDSGSPAAVDAATLSAVKPALAWARIDRWGPWLLVPSGCAALIYQVVWVRLLGLSMGSTSAAVSTVLTAFFIGMAVGSALAGRIAMRRTLRPLQAFAWLELLIGGSALALLPVLLHLDQAMALLGEAGGLPVLRFMVSLIVLAIPTLCMGATFPVFATALVRNQEEMGATLGWLYALNTAGAVLGALACGFVLIPRVGLDGAVIVAGSLNLLAALPALIASRALGESEPGAPNIPRQRAARSAPSPMPISEPADWRAGLLLFSTGFLAIAAEVGWTKYLSIVTGATIYGFAAILGIFLAGIASGAALSRAAFRRYRPHWSMLMWGLIGLAACLLIARVGLAHVPDWLARTEQTGGEQAVDRLGRCALVFVTLFPATFCLGALFPVSLSLYCQSVDEVPRRVGQAYAINTVGSILGALAAGFWIIPSLGTALLLDLLILATLLLSFWLMSWVSVRARLALSLIAAIGAGVLLLPNLDYTRLIAANPYRFDQDAAHGKPPRFLYLEEGKAGVISLVTHDETRAKLQNNGIQESYVPMVAGVRPPFTELLLGILPPLLHEAPKSAFVIGLGGGNTLQALAWSELERIKVVELEPAIARALGVAHGGKVPVLQDSRVDLVFNDARNELLVQQEHYDLIVSQPSHPWLAGAGNLFTRDFFEIASSHLNSGGLYAQWVNLFNMDATTLRSLLAAFYEVFPHGFAAANTASGDLILIGANTPVRFAQGRIAERLRNPSIQSTLAAVQIHRPEELLWYFSLSRAEALRAAAGVPANTDTRIMTEVRLADLKADPEGEESPYRLLETYATFDVLSVLEPDEAATMLYEAGRYFYRFHAVTRTRLAIQRLQQIDPRLARRLEVDWTVWKEGLRRQP